MKWIYTIFLVYTPGLSSIPPSLTKTEILYLDWTLDKATYNWPWVNTGLGKYNPIFEMVWPCALAGRLGCCSGVIEV